MAIAENVLKAFGEDNEIFIFQNRNLKISRPRLPQRQANMTSFNQLPLGDTSNTVHFSIFNVLYGTLIKSEVVNSIAGGYYANDLGFIAHRLITNENNIHLRIDLLQKKFAIIVTYSHDMYNASTDITFEWAFSA